MIDAGRVSFRQHRELIAAQPSDQIVVTHERGDALGDAHQQRVARGVSERVVDDLEIVQIDEQHGRHVILGCRRSLEHPLQGLVEGAPVGGAGERVTLGQVAHAS